jgi:hypothetical protein
MTTGQAPRKRRQVAGLSPGRRGLVVPALGVPFVALAVVLMLAPSSNVIADKVVGLVSVDLAIAVFAVNFSFLAYQLSPYRSLVRGVSPRHVTASLVLIFVALAPLLGFVWSDHAAARSALALTPILTYGGLLLVWLALREAEPMVLIARRLSRRSLNQFLARFADSVREQLRRRRDVGAPIPEEKVPPPTHELFFHAPPPPQLDDPVEFLVHAATVAITNSDTYSYAAVLERALALAVELEERTEPDDDIRGYKVKAALDAHALGGLQRIGRAAIDKDARAEFAARFVTTCAEFIERRTSERRQARDLSLGVLQLATDLGGELVERGSTEVVIGVLIASRQAAERGIVEVDDASAEFTLIAYPGAMEALGEKAIGAGNAEFLYRCLDAICWTGCAAVRCDGSDVGRMCMQVLVQLGRRARAANLECFWTRCALTPADHVDERLSWIATWVPTAQPNQRERWLESLSTAYSRLHGVRYNVTLDESRERPRVWTERTEQPHRETVNDNGRMGKVDYSDFAVLKKFNLY